MRSEAVALVALLGSVLAARPVSGEVIERILADVDGRPVLLSEARLFQGLRGLDPKAALEAAIDSRLMYREAARLPQAAVTDAEATAACESLKARAAAASAELPMAALCGLARREAVVVKYIDFRFAPQVREAPEGAQTRLSDRIEEWIKELRAAATIRHVP